MRLRYLIVPCLLGTAIALMLVSCGPKTSTNPIEGPSVVEPSPEADLGRGDVTGKGNGTDLLRISNEEIFSYLERIKQPLTRTFEALSTMLEIHNLRPDATLLGRKDGVPELLERMLNAQHPENNGFDIFKDIQVENNFDIQSEPCLDVYGNEKAATSVPGEVGGRICISLQKLREMSSLGGEDELTMKIISMLAHEFSHHYMKADTDDLELVTEQERYAMRLEALVLFYLRRYTNEEQDTISLNEFPAVDIFAQEMVNQLALIETSGASQVTQPEDEEVEVPGNTVIYQSGADDSELTVNGELIPVEGGETVIVETPGTIEEVE